MTPLFSVTQSCERYIYLTRVNRPSELIINEYLENITSDYKFSYSFDAETYSDWFDDYSIMLVDYDLNTSIETIDIKISVLSTQIERYTYSTLDIENISLTINDEEVLANLDYVEIVNNPRYADNISVNNVFNGNSFNVSKAFENIHSIREQLSDSIYEHMGWPVTYFKTEKRDDSKSVTFKTFTMHDVTDYKDININIVGNEIPINSPQFSEFMFENSDELTVDIVIKRFHDIFGESTFPNDRDYLYFPMMNEMYSINTPMEYRDVMNKGVSYRMVLVKYTDDAAVDDTLVKDQIDTFTKELSNQFSEEQEQEYDDASAEWDSVNDDSIETNLLEYASSIQIVETSLDIASTPIFSNMMLTYESLLTKYDITNSSTFNTFGMWFKISELPTNEVVNLIKLENDVNYVIDIYIKDTGKLSITRTTDEGINSTINGVGDIIEVNTLYYLQSAYDNMSGAMTFKLLDSNLDEVQSNADIFTNFIDVSFDTMSIFGNISVTNIRYFDSNVNDLIKLNATTKYPDDALIVDNATISLSGEKL